MTNHSFIYQHECSVTFVLRLSYLMAYIQISQNTVDF